MQQCLSNVQICSSFLLVLYLSLDMFVFSSLELLCLFLTNNAQLDGQTVQE